MDVGLNNRNTFEEPELKDVVFLVEATSCEQHDLWFKWASEAWDFDKISGGISLGSLSSESLPSRLGLQGSVVTELQTLLKVVEERNERVKKEKNRRVHWKSENMGFSLTIGHIGKKAVVVQFSFAYIDGRKIAFYNACSNVVDHSMVENWLIERFQRTHDGYTRWNHTDANNFHNCANYLDDIDEKPRNTIYKGER